MSELKITSFNGVEAIDSRLIAENIGKNHKELLRDIRTYCDYLSESNNGFAGERKIAPTDFFIESTYITSQNKVMPCYLCTRKGCEMIANKMTGQKGTVFTAMYINAFHSMEKQLKDSYMIDDPIERAKRWIQEQEQRKQLELTVKSQEQMIGELKPRADYTDQILKNTGLVTITQIAKDYGMSGQKLNSLLNDFGVQYKQSGQWLLYSKYHDKGYTHSETIPFNHKDGRKDVKMETKWTQKGRLFIYARLKAHGILPVIEREVDCA